MEKKICIICNKEFIPKRCNQRVCNDDHIFKCPICGKTYTATKTQIKRFLIRNRMSCCSVDCSNKMVKKTKAEKYGDENYNNYTKIISTKADKYGDKNYNNREKFKKTCLDKFGTNTPLENNDICNKMISTMQLRYNANSPLQNDSIKEKIKLNNINKYGVLNPTQLHYTTDTKEILLNKDKFIQFCEEYKNVFNFTLCSDILGVQDTTFRNYYLKYGCDKIYPIKNIFTEESEIEQLLQDNNIDYEKHNRKIIYPKELDYYIPSKNLAIEFNGTYWHSQDRLMDKNYHYNKSKSCEEKGIRLIHVFEYEWKNTRQRPILENIIKNALGINMNKIYARKCQIVVKQSKEMREFFEDNNIQGFRPGKFAICLTYNNEIVMAYMMGKAFFGKGKYEWEVIRGATKLGYTVVGGASKIFNYFVENYNPQNCVYYIDYNYFNGNSLKNLPKMKFIKTQPSFKNWWIKAGIVKNRNPAKHREINELYKSKEVIPIYNAGTKVYVWER